MSLPGSGVQLFASSAVFRLRRFEIWMTTEDSLRRYGDPNLAPPDVLMPI